MTVTSDKTVVVGLPTVFAAREERQKSAFPSIAGLLNEISSASTPISH
jgi:hypothetical protein